MILLQTASDQTIDVSWATDALLWIALLMLAAFAVIFVVGATLLLLLARGHRRRLAQSGIDDIDKMGGRVFEQYLEVMFKRLGYSVERTKFVGDFGGDLVLRKDRVRTVVQAKRYTRSVGVKAIQEVVAAKGYYDCDKTMVVTNSSYTKQARELARKNMVELWDRDVLMRHLIATGAKDGVRHGDAEATALRDSAADALASTFGARASAVAAMPLATVVTCSHCAKVLSSGERSYCEKNAKRFEGQMLCFRHQLARRS